jgi:hypothetical protein
LKNARPIAEHKRKIMKLDAVRTKSLDLFNTNCVNSLV